MGSSNAIAYSIGSLLAGFLFVLPFSLVGKLWNWKFPQRSVNSWSLPLSLSVVLAGLSIHGAGLDAESQWNELIMLFSFVPVFVFCLTRWLRWKRDNAS